MILSTEICFKGASQFKWIDAQDEWIVMTSTKWKGSSQQWLYDVTIAVWRRGGEWEHRNTILHNDQHS